MEPIYPNICIALSTSNGNAFVIISKCRSNMRRAGISTEKIEEFTAEATSGNYDKVLQTVMKHFNTD